MGAMLAEGWWSGGATYMGEFWNFFGDRASLLAKLVITYHRRKRRHYSKRSLNLVVF